MLETETLSAFESIGEDCEFGLVQDGFGYNPSTLMQSAGCSLNGLVRALEADFADLFRLDDVRPGPPGALSDVKYAISYKVDLAFTGDRLLRNEANLSRHRRLLRDTRDRLRQFHETLAGRRKVLLYKSSSPLLMGDVLRLKAALDLHGPQKLLYVVAATNDRPAGTVQRLASGVKVASLARLAQKRSDALEQIDSAAWLGVCRAALADDWGQRAVELHQKPQAPVQDGWSQAVHQVLG